MLIDKLKNDDGGVNFEKVRFVVKTYNDTLHDDAEEDLRLKGKTLEEANHQNAALTYYWDGKRVEVNSIMKWLERAIDRRRSVLFKYYTEKYARDLTDKAKERYIDSDEEYLDLYELYLEVRECHDTYLSLVDAFKSRGYRLKDIVAARIAQLNEQVI